MKTIQNILRYLVLLGVFLLPLTPLIVSTSLFFPYITGKAFFFRIIVEIIFAAWVVLALVFSKYRPSRSPILFSIIGLVIISALATILGANTYHSFWSNFERMEGLITYLHLLAYFLVLTTVLRTEKLWGWLLNVSLAVSIIVAFIALKQWLGSSVSSFRADATFGNPIYLAVYGLFHLFLALFVLARSSVRWQKIVYGIIGLLEVLTIYLTATRSAILGLLGGVFVGVLLIALFEREHRTRRKVAIGILVVSVLASAGFWLARDSSFIQNNLVLSRLASISLNEGTAHDRLLVWDIGWQGFKERPILGWGPENFNLVFNKYYDPQLYGAESWFDRSHNILIDWLVHAGILGLLVYLGLFFVSIYCLWKKTSWKILEKSLITGLLAAYFIHNIFVFDNLISYLLFFALLAYLQVKSNNEPLVQKTKSPDVANPLALWSTLPVMVALIFAIYFFNVKPMTAAGDLVQAISLASGQEANQEALFKKVFEAKTFGSGEASEQLINLTLQLVRDPRISNERKSELATLAVQQMSEQIKRSPDDARHQLFLGAFLMNVGQIAEGIKYLQKASELSPNKQQILFALGSAYWSAGQKNQALEIAKRAYELNPKVSDAEKFYEQVKKNF